MLRKARKVPKFKPAAVRWAKMKPNWLHVLTDDSADPGLVDAALVLLPTSLDVRLDEGDDLESTSATGATRAVMPAPLIVRDSTGPAPV